MAFTGIAALVAGEAVTAAVVLAAVTEVGMIMTVVGAATGSEDLMKLGGILGIVGGVGGAINGAMSGAAGAGAPAGAMTEAADAANAANAADGFGTMGIDGGALGAADTGAALAHGEVAGSNVIQQVGSAPAETAATNYGVPASNTPAPLDTNLAQNAATAPAERGIIGQPAQNIAETGVNVASPSAPGATLDNSMLLNGDGARINNASAYTPAGQSAALGGSQPSGGFFDKVSGLWKSMDGRTQSTLIGTAASMFSGAQQQSNIDKKLALERDRVNQTSYGSAVPRFSIINGRG